MTNTKDIFTFRGQVKITDVQRAFENLIERLNKMIYDYNTTDTFLQEQDYSVGSEYLGAANYCLTVGGIKQVLRAYNGTLLGCRFFKITDTSGILTDGIYFSEDKPIRISSQVLEGDLAPDNHQLSLRLNLSTGNIQLGDDDPDPDEQGCVPVAYLSGYKPQYYKNTYRNVQAEGLDGYSITINNRSLNWDRRDTDDKTRARFQGAGVYFVNASGGGRVTFMGQDELTKAWGGGEYRRHATSCPANFLFVPKGCPSPFWYDGTRRVEMTQYSFNITRPDS